MMLKEQPWTAFKGLYIGFFALLTILALIPILSFPNKANADDQVVGIGVKIQLVNVSLVGDGGEKFLLYTIFEVREVIPGSPAETAGLIAEDSITSVNGQNIKGMGLEDVGKLIRGEEGTYVEIAVSRLLKKDGELDPSKDIAKFNFRIKREKIKTN